MWHVYLCLCACLSAILHFARVTEGSCGLWSSAELKDGMFALSVLVEMYRGGQKELHLSLWI